MTEVEVTQEDEKTEAYIRIAIWNAAMSGGMGQELSQAFIRRAMDEPLMKRVIARHRTRSAGGAGERPTYASTYEAFTDGMKAAAEICGSLAETTYDDTDAFEAATGCEVAIMRVVKEQRAEQALSTTPAPETMREETIKEVARFVRFMPDAQIIRSDGSSIAEEIATAIEALAANRPEA